MKVIFLDLDGVVNNIYKEEECVNPSFVKNIKRVINATNTKVVITSQKRETLVHQNSKKDSMFYEQVYVQPSLDILNGSGGFYPPEYNRTETFDERMERLFPMLFLNKDIEEEFLSKLENKKLSIKQIK